MQVTGDGIVTVLDEQISGEQMFRKWAGRISLYSSWLCIETTGGDRYSFPHHRVYEVQWDTVSQV